LFEAFVQILLTIDDQPLVLFIDDLHWVDQATLDWLVYLSDRLQQHRLLLVGTYRPDEASPRLSRVTAGWGRLGILHRLPLQRLTLTESTELVTALGRSGDEAEPLHTRSAGNPYFLTELSQAEVEGTPPGLTELIRTRLSHLPDDARQILQAAAVLQDDFDLNTLRQTSGRGEEETLNALDVLLEAAVLIERNGGYEFAHPLVASVVRDDLSLARRSFLHRRAAEALELVHANQLDALAGKLSAHYGQAGRPVLAADYAERAAKRSLELGAYAEAVASYRRAVQLEDTPLRRLGLGQALIALDDVETGREELKAAGAFFEREQKPTEAGRAYLELALSYLPAGSGDEVLKWANKAVSSSETPPDPAMHARLHHLLAAGGLLAGEPLAQAEAHLLEAIELAEANDLPQLASIGRFELGNVLAQRGRLRQAIESFDAALVLAGDSLIQRILSHNNLAYHLMLAGDLTEALDQINTALALADEHALLGGRQYLYSTRGEIALAFGELDGAEAWLEKALTEARRNGNLPHAAGIKANFGLVARDRGDLDEALLLLEEARGAVATLSSAFLQIKIDLWLAELYLVRGERAAAGQALDRAQTRLSGSEMLGLQAWANRVQVRLEG
jgi:tetratricopeptide (TPR) repeat protein